MRATPLTVENPHPGRPYTISQVARNRATDFEIFLFEKALKENPEWSRRTFVGLEYYRNRLHHNEAERLGAALDRVQLDHGHLPPLGPPLLEGDAPPAKAQYPFDQNDEEIQEVTLIRKHGNPMETWYRCRFRGGRWRDCTDPRLPGRWAPPPPNAAAGTAGRVTHSGAPSYHTVSASGTVTLVGGPQATATSQNTPLSLRAHRPVASQATAPPGRVSQAGASHISAAAERAAHAGSSQATAQLMAASDSPTRWNTPRAAAASTNQESSGPSKNTGSKTGPHGAYGASPTSQSLPAKKDGAAAPSRGESRPVESLRIRAAASGGGPGPAQGEIQPLQNPSGGAGRGDAGRGHGDKGRGAPGRGRGDPGRSGTGRGELGLGESGRGAPGRGRGAPGRSGTGRGELGLGESGRGDPARGEAGRGGRNVASTQGRSFDALKD